MKKVKNVEGMGERMVSVDVVFNCTVFSVGSEHTNALVCMCNRSEKSLLFLRGCRDSQGWYKQIIPLPFTVPYPSSARGKPIFRERQRLIIRRAWAPFKDRQKGCREIHFLYIYIPAPRLHSFRLLRTPFRENNCAPC